MARRYDDDPELVLAAQGGNSDAFTTLFRRWFDPCVEVARRIVHDEETAAEVAQETFLVAWRQLDTLREPSAFGGWVLRTSRNKALNRLERERRSIAVDQDEAPVLAGLEAVDDVAAEVAVAEQQQLLWAASAALGERDASVLDLHLRHGLDAGELAEALGVTPNNAHQLVFRMKGRLAGAIRAWVLYKGGDPACPELGRALQAAGATSFSASTVKVIDRHVKACDDCGRRQAAILAPEAMFAAVPALPVAGLLRERAAAALRDSGVPLGPDAAGAPTDAADGPDADPGSEPDPGSDAGPDAAAGPDDPWPTSAARAATTDRRRAARLAGAAVAVVVVLVVVGLVLANRDGDDEASPIGAVVEATVPVTEPRSGTSVPASDLPLAEPTTTATPAPTTTTSRPPTTTAPPVAPPVTPPPPPAAPQVLSFTASANATCAAGGFAYTLSWTTAGATSVSISPSAALPGGQPVVGGPTGTAQGCALTPGATWTLVATGPGGTASATD